MIEENTNLHGQTKMSISCACAKSAPVSNCRRFQQNVHTDMENGHSTPRTQNPRTISPPFSICGPAHALYYTLSSSIFCYHCVVAATLRARLVPCIPNQPPRAHCLYLVPYIHLWDVSWSASLLRGLVLDVREKILFLRGLAFSMWKGKHAGGRQEHIGIRQGFTPLSRQLRILQHPRRRCSLLQSYAQLSR